MDYPKAIKDLIVNLTKLPGIGRKTATRLAFFILKMPDGEVKSIANALSSIKENIILCDICFNFCESSPCKICSNDDRDRGLICVIESPHDLYTIERSGGFRGIYHVLHGSISPLEGIGPDKLRIRELVKRVETGGVREVIMATNTDMEGEATSMYIAKLLKPFDLAITRIARGLPIGADIEFADELTITKALEGRVKVRDW